jgi:hypothetical protein
MQQGSLITSNPRRGPDVWHRRGWTVAGEYENRYLCLANCNFAKPQGMSQCYIPSLYVVHFKGALNSDEAQLMSVNSHRHSSVREAIVRFRLHLLVAITRGCDACSPPPADLSISQILPVDSA